MTHQEWVRPLLDYYPHERIIFTAYIRPNKRGTFSVTRQKEAQERLGVSVRYLYKVRNRAEKLARLYEALVETGVIE
jgi:hypothetical protein